VTARPVPLQSRSKHRATIESDFQVGSHYLYIIKSAVKYFSLVSTLPYAIRTKRGLLGER
jgi:hypothetical protein